MILTTFFQLKEIMGVRSYCAEYYLLSDTKIPTSNNIGVLLNGVLTDLRARNFVHTKISFSGDLCTLVTVGAIYGALKQHINVPLLPVNFNLLHRLPAC